MRRLIPGAVATAIILASGSCGDDAIIHHPDSDVLDDSVECYQDVDCNDEGRFPRRYCEEGKCVSLVIP